MGGRESVVYIACSHRDRVRYTLSASSSEVKDFDEQKLPN